MRGSTRSSVIVADGKSKQFWSALTGVARALPLHRTTRTTASTRLCQWSQPRVFANSPQAAPLRRHLLFRRRSAPPHAPQAHGGSEHPRRSPPRAAARDRTRENCIITSRPPRTPSDVAPQACPPNSGGSARRHTPHLQQWCICPNRGVNVLPAKRRKTTYLTRQSDVIWEPRHAMAPSDAHGPESAKRVRKVSMPPNEVGETVSKVSYDQKTHV